MTDANKIEVEKIENGNFAISFPFELKDQFRAAFPSARWDRVTKTWIVGPRSGKRLQEWVDQVNNSGLLDEIAGRDEAEMTESEINALAKEIEKAKSEARAARETHEANIAKIESVETLREKLQAEVEARNAAQSEMRASTQNLRESTAGLHEDQAEAAQSAEAAEPAEPAADDLHARAATIIDLNRVEKLRETMLKNTGLRNGEATGRYRKAENELDEMHDKIRDSGIECDAIRRALSASKNWTRAEAAPLMTAKLEFTVYE